MLLLWQRKIFASGLGEEFANSAGSGDGRRITWPFTPAWGAASYLMSKMARKSRASGLWRYWLSDLRCPYLSFCVVFRGWWPRFSSAKPEHHDLTWSSKNWTGLVRRLDGKLRRIRIPKPL